MALIDAWINSLKNIVYMGVNGYFCPDIRKGGV